MTFFESLKKWFYTKNSSAASSDARVPLLDASGNPKGSDTMANLASVLGGYKSKSIPEGSTENVYRTFSFDLYDYAGSRSFLLSTFDGAYIITALKWAGSAFENVALYQLTDTGGQDINDFSWSISGNTFTIYFGKGSNVTTLITPLDNIGVTVGTSASAGSNTLTPQNIPSFYKDYASLSALATGLGVIKTFSQDDFNSADEINENCMVAIARQQGVDDYNVPRAYGVLLCLKPALDDYTAQIFIPHVNGVNDTNLYFRFNNQITWSSWIKLTGEALT